MDNKKRGTFLQQLRKEKGLTQEELGEKLHYSYKTISNWEQGNALPNNPETLEKLCEIYNVSLEELFYGERKNKNNQNDISKNMEDVYKNDYSKHKKTINLSIFLGLLVLVISMLFIYFVFIKGKILLYVIEGENEHFTINKSTLLLTNELDTLNFSKVISKNNEHINYIRLYYVKDSKEHLLFKGDNDVYYIEEVEGYNEYNLNNLKNSELYIEINYDSDTIETIKLNVSKRFVNNKIFCHKAKKISNDNEQINVSDEKLIELLSKEDFKRIDDLYEKTYKNYRIAYDQSTKSIFIFNNDKTKYEQIRYKLKDNFIIYEYLDNNKNINSYIYSIEDESTFNSNNFLKFCLDYITYITENI